MSSIVEELLPYASKWYVILIGAVLLYNILKYIKVQRFQSKHGCKQPNKVDGGFLGLGLIFNMLKAKNKGTMMELSKKILDEFGVSCRLRLVGVPIVFTEDPENIKALLGTQFNDFALGTRHAHFKPLLGDGIFTLDAQGWKNSRAMLRPQFGREQIAHVKSLEPHVKTLLKHISKMKGDTIDLQHYFFKLTMDTATEFLFGESVHTLKDDSINEKAPIDFEGRLEFADAFNTSQSYLSTRSYTQMFYFLVNNKEFRDCNATVHKFTNFFVDRVLATDPEELDEKSKGGYTFLYELAKQTRDPKILRDQALNILLAGRDTTAGLLSFTMYELARNPDVFQKLRKAVIEGFGTGTDEDIDNISFETLKKCEYLKFVVNEVLRLYPSVPNNFRVSTRDTTLPRGGGPKGDAPIYVGKGTTVAYSIFSTHRLEEYYGKDSLEFKPERWADLNKLGWAYLPFNGGPRICLGQQFALTEASYVIVRLCQMFSNLSSRDNGPYPPTKNVQLTMCLQEGAFVSMS